MSGMSMTDVLDIRIAEGMLEVGRLVDKDNLPQTPEELKRLKEYALSKELWYTRADFRHAGCDIEGRYSA